MKIGLDLHGVITDLPDLFKYIGESVIKNGGEIHIITGGSLEKAEEELQRLGYVKDKHFTITFSILDHLENIKALSTGTHPIMGNKEYPNVVWDSVKGWYCSQNNISLHIDDSLVYSEYFETPFARIWTKTNTPKINKPIRHLD